jgi:hypothetical protein
LEDYDQTIDIIHNVGEREKNIWMYIASTLFAALLCNSGGGGSGCSKRHSLHRIPRFYCSKSGTVI